MLFTVGLDSHVGLSQSNLPIPQLWSVLFLLMLFTVGLDSQVGLSQSRLPLLQLRSVLFFLMLFTVGLDSQVGFVLYFDPVEDNTFKMTCAYNKD